MENHASRTAANSAAFLLDQLQATDRLLDLGCGPGSITIGLAQYVASVTGVDSAPKAIELAEEASADTTNVSWHTADVYDLPFVDESFDVVYAHQLLQHVADPVAALGEARRVLRPGGLLAVRDADYGTMVHSPHHPGIDRWLRLYAQLARANGGEPDAGRHLPQWVNNAGFGRLAVSTSTWTYSTRQSVDQWTLLWTSRLREARMGRDLVDRDLATPDEIEELAQAFEAWANSPQPFFAFLHGEVLATKPGGSP